MDSLSTVYTSIPHSELISQVINIQNTAAELTNLNGDFPEMYLQSLF